MAHRCFAGLILALGLLFTPALAAQTIDFIDADGNVTAEVLEGGLARLRLTSPADNLDPGAAEMVNVQVTSLYGADLALTDLTETGADTGVFEGGIQLASPWKFGLFTGNSGPSDFFPDQVTADYAGGAATAVATTRGALVALVDDFGQETAAYGLGQNVRVRLEDHNSNDPGTIDTVPVTVESLASLDSETVVLTETGYDVGIFEGSIATVPVSPPADGELGTQLGETVRSTYPHLNDPGLETADAIVQGSQTWFLDGLGQVAASYQEGSTAYVRLVDVLADFDPFSADVVALTLSSFLAGDVETLLLTETDLATGVFEGSIPLDVQFATTENGFLSTSESGGPPPFDTLTATYNDQSGTMSTATATTRGSRVAFLDAYGNEVTAYATGSTVYVRIEDHTLNNDPFGFETAAVEIVSLVSGDSEAFLILETGMDTGIFEGSLPLEFAPPAPGDGVLQAVPGELVEARHDDFFGFTQATDQALIQDAAIFFIDENGAVTFELLEGGIARVRLLSEGDNFDPFNPDQVIVEITSFYAGDFGFVTLTETGADTGVFEGGIQLASFWVFGFFTANSGPPEFLPEQVTVKWDPAGEVSATALTRGSRLFLIDDFGRVTSSYGLGETIRLRLVEPFLNDPLTIDLAGVQVDALGSGDNEFVTLTETGFNTGIFEGSISPTTNPAFPGDGELTAGFGETVEATAWHFNDPGLETAQAVVTGSAVYFVDGLGQSAASYQEGSTAYVRLVDAVADFNPFALDVVALTLSSFFAGDVETLFVTETGLATGVFEGSIPLDVQFATTENGFLSTSEFGGPPHVFDTLTATYNDQSGTTATATATTEGSRVAFLDADGNEMTAYAIGSTVYVRIEDHTRNNDPLGFESAAVEIVSLVSGDSEAFLILETGMDTGIFEGSLPLVAAAPAPGDSVLQAFGGELIEARHDDFFGFTQATDQALIQDAAIFFIDENGAVTLELLEGGIARVRLLSEGDNFDPFNPEQVFVEITSFYGLDMAPVTLTETGADTGVFEGGIQLASFWKFGLFTANSGPPEFLPDQVTVKWDPAGEVSATALTRGSRLFLIDDVGQVTSSYGLGETIRLRLVEPFLNDPLTIDLAGVQVDALGSGDNEFVTLTETGFDTGIFEGSISPTTNPAFPGDGELTADFGETVEATAWHFNDPGLETAQAVVTGSAVYFVDGLGQLAASYQEGSTAYVRLVDVVADFNPFSLDVVALTLSSLLAGDVETLFLTETGLATGVFEGSIPLDVQPTLTENGLLSTSEFGGPPHLFDTLTATYNDQSGTTATATATTEGSRVAFLDADGNEMTAYAIGATVYVRIEDHTRNNDPLGFESAAVEIVSLVSGDSEAFLILETGLDTGIFEGSLPLWGGPANPGDSVLQAGVGELIEARHDDFFGLTQATDQALIQDAAIFFIDENGAVTFELLEGEFARVRLLSEGDNFDPGNPDQVAVEITSFYGGDFGFVTLTETGADTGVFEGGIQLASFWVFGFFTANSGPPEFLPDQVTVKWDPAGEVSATALTRGSRLFLIDDFGRVTSSYGLGEAIRVRLVEPFLNDPLTIDLAGVQVDALGSGDNEFVTLTEMGVDTGIFEGSISPTTNPAVPGDGELTADFAETVEATAWHFNDPGLEKAQAMITGSAVYFVDAAGQVSAFYQEGSTAYVRLVDVVADFDPFSADVVALTLSSFFAGDLETLVLTETGPATGVFEGSIPLDVQLASMENGFLSTSEFGGPPHLFETLTATYNDISGTTSTATATTEGSRVTFLDAFGNEVTAYASGSTVYVRLENPVRNNDPLVVEWTDVEIVSLVSGDNEPFVIPETGVDTGIFEGSLPLGFGPPAPDGVLQAFAGELIEVRHDDVFGFTQATDQALIQDAVILFIDENGAVTFELLEGGIARVRLLSAGDNLDPGSPDTVNVQIASFYGGDLQLMLVTETGADTGVFEGAIQLASPWKFGLTTANSGAPDFLPDQVTVQWDPGGTVSATATTLGARADFVDALGLPVTVYAESPARLRIVDHNLNDPAVVDSFFEGVSSSSGDSEAVWLNETGSDTGVFTAAQLMTEVDFAIGNGLLGAADGDRIQVVHPHLNDPRAATAMATITGDLCYFAHSLTAGLWEMISLPCDVGASDSVTEVFGDDLDPLDYGVRWGLFERDEVGQANKLLDLADPLNEGEGYWIKTLDAAPQGLSVVGQSPAVVDVPLVADPVDGVQNMVGHPFNFDVCWADVTVVDGAAVLTLDQADPLIGPVRACDMVPPDPSCVMSRVGRSWNGAAYDPFDGVTMGMQGTLEPFDGLWVEAFKPGVALRIPATPGVGCVFCLPQPVANAGPDAAICAGDSVTLGTPAQAGHTYSWSPGGQTTAQITVSPAATTTYTLTATTLCGTVQDSVTVTVSAGGGGGFNEDFEGAVTGWTMAGATSLWHLVDSSTCFSPALGYTSPTHSFYYGLDGTPCNFNTGAASLGTLTSPSFAVDAASALTFQYLRSAETGGTWDETEIFVVDGAAVTSLPEIVSNASAWTTYGPQPLDDWAGRTVQLRFSFDTRDSVANTGTGWMIDDVAVSGCAPPLTVAGPVRPSPTPVFGPQPWLIRLAAESGDLRDPDNVFGQLADALDGYDYHDVPELAPFGDGYLSVVFPHDDWAERSGDYATDFRALGSPAATWRFDVVGAGVSGPVTLRWTAEGAEPRDVTLVDEVSGTRTPVVPGGSYTFTMSGDRHPFSWIDELCTGDDASGDADLDGICGNLDNCPSAANADQAESDGDGVGDACDLCWGNDASGDADGDGACADVDCDDTDPAARVAVDGACGGGASDDVIFSDGFESGGTSAWSSVQGG